MEIHFSLLFFFFILLFVFVESKKMNIECWKSVEVSEVLQQERKAESRNAFYENK